MSLLGQPITMVTGREWAFLDSDIPSVFWSFFVPIVSQGQATCQVVYLQGSLYRIGTYIPSSTRCSKGQNDLWHRQYQQGLENFSKICSSMMLATKYSHCTVRFCQMWPFQGILVKQCPFFRKIGYILLFKNNNFYLSSICRSTAVCLRMQTKCQALKLHLRQHFELLGTHRMKVGYY